MSRKGTANFWDTALCDVKKDIKGLNKTYLDV